MADIDASVLLKRLKWIGAGPVTWLDGKHPLVEKYYQVYNVFQKVKRIDRVKQTSYFFLNCPIG